MKTPTEAYHMCHAANLGDDEQRYRRPTHSRRAGSGVTTLATHVGVVAANALARKHKRMRSSQWQSTNEVTKAPYLCGRRKQPSSEPRQLAVQTLEFRHTGVINLE